MAFETLLANKMRSALTVLGVFIAVVVLVMVFSIMYGVDADLRAQLEQYGTDTLFVFKFEPGIHLGRLPQELRMRKPLKYEDAEAIREEAPSVKEVCVELDSDELHAGSTPTFIPMARYNGKEVTGVNFEGATPSFRSGAERTPGAGPLPHRNRKQPSPGCCGNRTRPGGYAVSGQGCRWAKICRSTGMTFRVIGVLEKSKGVFLRDNSADKQVYHPLPHLPEAPSAGQGKLLDRAGVAGQEVAGNR